MILNTKKELFCRSLKQAPASADAAHQRQLLLAAAESVSRDARPPFVYMHAGPDT